MFDYEEPVSNVSKETVEQQSVSAGGACREETSDMEKGRSKTRLCVFTENIERTGFGNSIGI